MIEDVSVIPGQILLEINSFANPFPYNTTTIRSFVFDYLISKGYTDIINDYELEPFEVNVLDKRTTMTEKLVSLIRFSLSDNPVIQLESKIRHFYDLHYLYGDEECKEYLTGIDFKENLISLYKHDQELFDNPKGWKEREIDESPLLQDIHSLWHKLSGRYTKELISLSFSHAIPKPNEIETSLTEIMFHIKS